MEGQKNIFQDFYFWISLGLGGFFLAMTLWFSLGTDQSLYAYSAWVWKAYHLPPYLGSWNHNWPGSHLLHRLALEIFGAGILSFRLFDFLAQLSSLMIIYYLAQRLSRQRTAGFLASVFYGIYYFQLNFTKTDEKEGYVLWLLLFAVFCALRFGRRAGLRAVLVGGLSGLVFLVKPTFGLCWPVFGVWFLATGLRQRPSRVWLELLIFGICCLIPALLVVFYYWRLDALNQLYDAAIWFNFAVYSQMIHLTPVAKFKAIILMFYNLAGERPLMIVSAIFAILIPIANWKEYQEKSLFLVILSLILVSLLSILIQGKNFLYYWIPFWGFLMIFSGAGFSVMGSRLAESDRSLRSKFMAGMFYLILILLAVASINLWSLKFAIRCPFRDLRSAYLYQSDVNFRVAEYLQPLLKPGDEIELIDWNPMLAFLLKKKLPSRFACFETLLFRHRDGKLRPKQKEWMSEYTGEVIKARPRFFLVSFLTGPERLRDIYNLPELNLEEALAKEFPDLQKFLEQNYQLINTIGTIKIYQRVSP